MTPIRRLLRPLPLVLLLAGCQHDRLQETEASLLAANEQAGHAFGPEISAEDFSAHIKVIASDEFGGRQPGSDGETKTTEYLREQLQRLGLEPGNGNSYFQTVPMVETRADTATSKMTIKLGDQSMPLSFGDQMVLGTRSGQAEVKVGDSPLVFVGYGVNAPEAGWNDYAGVDVKGKTVVMLINDPGFHNNDATLFQGRRMTYYGRWTYKFEEAARQGAAAAIIIHDTPGAAYGWDVVKNSWSGSQFDLPAAEEPGPRLSLQGWMTGEVASKLFSQVGLDVTALRDAAGKRGFKAVALGNARLDAELHSTISQSQSRNVVARLRGSKYPDEAIVYTAHWDHLGTHSNEPDDNIYNGAIDNATGVAGVLEIAEQFTVQEPRPERSVVFLFVTLEESGLLGSAYYAAHPVVPLAKTVAVINIDAMPVVGLTRDLVVVGLGNSELEDVLRPITDLQKRVLTEESAPEKGQFFRSDHFSFAKAGVPALYAKGGVDHIEKGREYGLAVTDDYTAKRYHKPADNFDPEWDLRGIVQDLNALYGVGKVLSTNRGWPNYREGNAFKAVRDASRAKAE
ncbi:MAG: M28 family metallopeptidase [Gammaproteobacteria bacterium]|nr:M28 family metallopeptidase [Gammaproteobacteria bacterium]